MLAMTAAAGQEGPSYAVTTRKPADSVVAVGKGERVTLLVTCPSGIGSAKVRLTAGRWPGEVALRFQYERGKGFKALEHLRVQTSRVQFTKAVGEAGDRDAVAKADFQFAGPDGTFIREGPAAGSLNLTVRRRDGALEVVLPPNLLTGEGALEVDWIDYYRN
jgi:hypothetical protein